MQYLRAVNNLHGDATWYYLQRAKSPRMRKSLVPFTLAGILATRRRGELLY